MGLTREDKPVFESQIEKELYNAFAFNKETTVKYIALLGDLIDKTVLIDTIRSFGRKGQKIPTPEQIKAVYFKTLDERKPKKSEVPYGIYDYKTRNHVKNTTKVFPSNDLTIVVMENPRDCPDYLWNLQKAVDFDRECNRLFWEKYNTVKVAKNRPSLAYPKTFLDESILCDEQAIPF